MTTVPVRITEETRRKAQRLAKQQDLTMSELIQRAVNSLEEALFWERMREGYDQLRRDPDAWDEHVAETRTYDSSANDGLKDEPDYPQKP